MNKSNNTLTTAPRKPLTPESLHDMFKPMPLPEPGKGCFSNVDLEACKLRAADAIKHIDSHKNDLPLALRSIEQITANL